MPASMHILPFGTRGSIWDMSPLMITSQPPFFTKPSTQPAGQPPASSWAVAALAAVRLCWIGRAWEWHRRWELRVARGAWKGGR